MKIIIQSFYPLMLNAAKRSRTTVEALELKGYRYAATNLKVLKTKLSSLHAGTREVIFVVVSVAWVVLCFVVSRIVGL
ncbi:MAG: hypothetical protein Q4B91_02155 [Atopobiaceae bacterium]|nr:hypothetical protein [Atopobiaceae bacterium]